MSFHYVYAGVHFEFAEPFALDKGAMVPAELYLEGDPILQDADEWYSNIGTAYPFTVDGILDWWEAEGYENEAIQKAAIEHAEDYNV